MNHRPTASSDTLSGVFAGTGKFEEEIDPSNLGQIKLEKEIEISRYRNDPDLLLRLKIVEEELRIIQNDSEGQGDLFKKFIHAKCELSQLQFRGEQFLTTIESFRKKEREYKSSIDRIRLAYYQSDWDQRQQMMSGQQCKCEVGLAGRPLREQLQLLIDAVELEVVGIPGQRPNWSESE